MEYKFELSEQEIYVYEKWLAGQLKKFDNLASFDHYEMGDRFSISFTPSAIGVLVTAIDHHLKEEKLLTSFN